MDLKLLQKKSLNADQYNEILAFLRGRLYQCEIQEDKEKERNEIIDQVNSIKLNDEKFDKLSTENQLFYLNYNTRFATLTFYGRKYEEKLEILKKILKIDLKQHENILLVSDFIKWSSGFLYSDKDMSKLVKYFCDNTGLEHSSLIFEMYSVLQVGLQKRCKEIITKKRNELKLSKKENLSNEFNI